MKKYLKKRLVQIGLVCVIVTLIFLSIVCQGKPQIKPQQTNFELTLGSDVFIDLSGKSFKLVYTGSVVRMFVKYHSLDYSKCSKGLLGKCQYPHKLMFEQKEKIIIDNDIIVHILSYDAENDIMHVKITVKQKGT